MRFHLCVLFVTASFATACGNCNTTGQAAIEYNGGSKDAANLTWESSPLFGEYLHFVPGRRFDLMHHLGSPVSAVHSWVSFARIPANPDDNKQDENTGNIAESAGNQVVIECADPERVRIRNDTCAEYFVRVEVRAKAGMSGAAGAAGAAGASALGYASCASDR